MIDKHELLKIVKQVNPAAKDGIDFIRKGILNSLEIVTLVVKLEAAYGVEISPVYIDEENFNSLDSIAKLIEKCANEKSDSALKEDLLNFDINSYKNLEAGSVKNKNMFASELQLNPFAEKNVSKKKTESSSELTYKFDVCEKAENVIQLLEHVSAKLPSKVAVKDSYSGEISFSELVNRSKKIASYLAKTYGSGKSPIFVIARRNIKSIVMILAVIFSGNFYICIDESLSEKKTKELVKTVNPRCALWDYNSKSDFLFDIFEDIEIYDEIIESQIDPDLLDRVANGVSGGDPLYGVFTSGTTGNPKCIVKKHDTIIRFISEYADLLDLTAEDNLGSKLSLMFDAFSKDLYSMIYSGSTMMLMPTGNAFLKDDAELIIKHHISSIVWTPSLLKSFARLKVLDAYSLASLKNVLFVGDQVSTSVIDYWRNKLPNTKFINLYGTSEMTGNCLYKVIHKSDEFDYVTLDKVFSGYDVKLDEESGEKANGFELLVKGSLMASWRMDEDGMHEVDAEAFYRTGDFFGKQGNDLIYLGRKDDYFKHEGYRVSPLEVEKTFTEGNNCGTVVCVYDYSSEDIIVVWDGEISLEEEFRKKAEEVLPKYMRPNRYIHMESVPVNSNGKLSRMDIIKCVQDIK